MKKSFLFLSVLFTMFFASAQDISDVSLSSGNLLTVRDANNNRISEKYLANSESVCGFSSSIIVLVTPGRLVTIYDKNFNRISERYIGENERVKNVSGNNVIVKNANGLVTVYDKNWNRISERYE